MITSEIYCESEENSIETNFLLQVYEEERSHLKAFHTVTSRYNFCLDRLVWRRVRRKLTRKG